MKTTIRAWTKGEYYKDVAVLSEQQVFMAYEGMEANGRHLVAPLNAARVVIDPTQFPEAIEFEIIVQE